MTAPFATTPLDPAQLVALHLLLEEKHVTRAARRLGITQSSMSHRLAQLRAALGDPLLVGTRGQLELTPRAQELAGPLALALAALEAVVERRRPFDPRTDRYALTVALPDLLAPVVGPLTARLQREAPGVTLRFAPIPPKLSEFLAGPTPLLALAPAHFAASGSVTRLIGTLEFAVACRRDHPSSGERLTRAAWLRAGHVVVRTGNDAPNPIEVALSQLGEQRHIALEVPSFLMGLLAVATSDLMMNVPVPLASAAADQFGLCVLRAPIPLPAVRFSLLWHERFTADSAHRFVRELLVETLTPAFKRR